MIRSRVLLLAMVSMLTLVDTTWGYDIATHRELGLRAARSSSSLQSTVRDDLGFADAATTLFVGQIAEDWIRAGAGFEDVPFFRVLNHFHNPLNSWSEAGLRIGTPPRSITGPSSVLWGQRTTQDSPDSDLILGGGTWSWPFARTGFLTALTDRDPGTREAAFAKTFRALGQLTHLVQDASVPAHVRNDPHLSVPIFGRNIGDPDPYEEWVERTRTRSPGLFNVILAGPTILPNRFVFAPTGDVGAPSPIAGLIDTKTFLGLNPLLLSGVTIGIAEFTNGNFLSSDRLFHPDFLFPRLSSVDLQSPIVESERGRVRRYFPKVDDGNGTPVAHFVAEGLLYESTLAARGAPLPMSFALQDRVHQDYAQILLPRAVGYSAALIDYFFRGKLDGDIVTDPNDSNPDIVRFSGTNASPEALSGGTLLLYGENAAGIRTPLVALDADVAVSAEPGAAVRSARFTATGDAEKFVAVYRGALGNEQPGTDAQTAPGAVIGKVLGGPRVEQIFSDGTRWYLRTPDGVVALPILAADIEDLRWGDVDNTLVGRSKLGLDPDARNLFRAYRINRPVGSITVPTTTDANGARLVDAVQTVEATLPAELAIGTVVRFAGSVRVTEDLATFEGGARSFGYDPSTGDYVPLGRPDGRPEAPAGSEVTIERTVDQARTVTADFPVLLTKATYNNPGGLNYFWRLVEIGLDASDRLLALVEVILTEPANANGRVTVKRRNALTGVLEPAGEVLTRVSFPISPLLLALVDVRTQQVVATTAAPEVILGVDSVTPTTRMQGHATALAHDGPLDGQVITRWFELPLRAHVEPPAPPGDTPETPFLANVTVAQESGVTRLQITGRYTPTLAALVQSDITIQQSEPVRQPYLFAIEPDGNGFPVFRGFNVDTTFLGPVGYSATLQQGQRLRPSPVGEIVLLFSEPVGISEGEKGVLVRLTPSDTARLVLTDELPPAATHRLVGTTSKRTLVVSRGFETVSRLADLEAGTVAEFFGDDLGQQFVLLDPTRLYNVDDLRFYRPAPPLVKTALPRRLAGVTDNPRGDYHTIETK